MANFNYFAHRQFYINGLTKNFSTQLDAESLQNHETGVTEALRQLSPVYKFEGIKPLPIYASTVEEVHGQNGNVIDTVSITKCNIFAFRNGEEIYKKANAYFNKAGNKEWNKHSCALVSVSDWGLKTDRLDGDYEFFIFDNNGFLLNNSYNTFVVSITGVLYFVMSDCESWHGMYNVDTDETLDFSKSIAEGNFLVDVVAIRKNEIPYAIVPDCRDEADYSDKCVVANENGTSSIPQSIFVHWDSAKETSWFGQELSNYGLFVTLGGDASVAREQVSRDSLSAEWQAIFDNLGDNEKENFLCSIVANANDALKDSKGLNFEVTGDAYDLRILDSRDICFNKQQGKTIADLGIVITVPVELPLDREAVEVSEAAKEGVKFALTKLPAGSRFYASTRAVQFTDEIRMNSTMATVEGEDKAEISITSKAYPAGLGHPFFDKYQGLAYIPLGKYTGTVQDYGETLAEDTDIMHDSTLNNEAYETLGGYPGTHVYPLLTPKAEDVMIFVGNRKGMVKLTPYVDYTIEASGSPVTGNMPAIMLMGRAADQNYDTSDPFSELVGNGPLTAIQLNFPKPIPDPDSPANESKQDNGDIFIRVFVGYRRGKVSSYWGPTSDKIPAVSNGVDDEIAAHGFSIPNTVKTVNSNANCYVVGDTIMLSTATMLDNDSIPWSILPRECFLEFNAGRYKKCCDNYTSRILLDRTFSLGTDRPRDVELHALIDERFGIAYALSRSSLIEFPYFDGILSVLGVADTSAFIVSTAGNGTEIFEVDSQSHLPSDANNNKEAFAYINGITSPDASQITEAINASMWRTWYTTVDDEAEDTDDSN